MLLPRSATVIALTFAAMSAAAQTPPAPSAADRQQPAKATALPDAAPASCRVTLPSDGRFLPPAPLSGDPAKNMSGLGTGQFWFGSSKLWTMLPLDGTWRAWQASQPGDFAYSNKLPWFRMHPGFSGKDGSLTVTGKRLDGPAPVFTETEETYGGTMIMGGIAFPVFGCWQVTGHDKDQELIFAVWVAPPAKQKQPVDVSLPAAISEPPKPAPRLIYVDAATQAKSLVYKVTPEIPPGVDVAGTVLLHAVIGTDGRPRDLQYVSGPLQLLEAAIKAVTWWQYRVTGEAEEVDTMIEVAFPTLGA
ncbi:MAG: hypothetical protein ABR880_17830 [Candidatus Sulfotelmatobacter sp.]|jgi:hypothetical protein